MRGARVVKAAFALRTLQVAALLVCLAGVALTVVERTGWLTARVQEELRARLGDDARVDRVVLDWFTPAIEAFGVALGDERGGFEVEHARIVLGWRSGRPVAERIDLVGGRLLLSNSLIERAESIGARESATVAPAEADHTPIIVVRSLQLDVLHPSLAAIEIGRVDALWRQDRATRPHIEGRVTPSFSAARGPQSPQIFLSGSLDADGAFEILASCAGIPVDSSALPRGLRDGELARWDPRARLEFELSARFRLDPDAPAEGSLRARLEHGELSPPDVARPLTELTLDIDARCSAPSASELLDPATWRTTAHGAALWNTTELEAWALAGANAGPELAVRAWLRAPRLPLDETFWREVGLFDALEPNWTPLSPTGHVDALVGARWATTRSFADASAAARPEIAADLRFDGHASVTYRGWPREGGGEREGFPAPVEQIVGHALAVHSPDSQRLAELAILEVIGAHSGGARNQQPAFIEGIVRFERADAAHPARRLPGIDLEIGAHGFPVDQRMRTALLSLLPDDLVWRQFAPGGGHVSTVVRLVRAPGESIPAANVSIDLFDVGGAWRPESAEANDPAPAELPLREINGRIEVLADPRLAVGVRFDLTAAATQRATVRVRGRLQDDAAQAHDAQHWQARRMQELSVTATRIGLGGADRRMVARVWPQIAHEIERREANGWADIDYRSATERPGGPLDWRVEVAPRTTELSPEEFRIGVRNVRGRVIVTGSDSLGGSDAPATTTVRITPLLGDTLGAATVACNARIESDGRARVEVLAAGVSPSNPGIVGAFKHAFERDARGGQTGLSLSALAVDGKVDLGGVILTSPAAPARPDSRFRVYLRENDVQTTLASGRFELDRLSGVLESRAEELLGERLTGTLAGAPIELRNARFYEREDSGVLATEFDASEFALDREHLAMFFDRETVDVLLDERALRGVIDMRGGRLELESNADRTGAVRVSGQVLPRTLSLDLGLPLSIEAARIDVRDLDYDGKTVRAHATFDGVRGKVADRRLENAMLQVEFDDPTLTVHDVRGELEGGALSRLDPRGERPAFKIDLRDPFAFSLGLALERAEVGGLLAGLFESEFATRGRVTLRVELDGDLDRMGAIRGSGRVDLRDSNLWSVPVVRDLVTQFGLDSKSALFDSIQSRFSIADGQVRMSDLDISSAYFGVSGSGSLDFDGTLRHDFEVRNTVVNLLGPIKNVLYRIAIRGDMARPRVETYGVLGQSFSETRGRTRALPLPSLSPVPTRF